MWEEKKHKNVKTDKTQKCEKGQNAKFENGQENLTIKDEKITQSVDIQGP